VRLRLATGTARAALSAGTTGAGLATASAGSRLAVAGSAFPHELARGNATTFLANLTDLAFEGVGARAGLELLHHVAAPSPGEGNSDARHDAHETDGPARAVAFHGPLPSGSRPLIETGTKNAMSLSPSRQLDARAGTLQTRQCQRWQENFSDF